MIETAENFDKRLRRVTRRHRKIYTNGARTKVGRDGLITAVPRRRAPRFPLRGVVILFAAALAYKAVMFAWLGPAVYGDRVDELQSGTVVEQAGAWALQADPVTIAIADFINPYLPR